MSTFSRRLGWTLVGASLLLHLFTVYCFSLQPDRFAAFTVMPIWLWGGFGLGLSTIAFYFFRTPLSLVMTAVWAITLLVGADEARVLAHLGRPAPLPGPATTFEGKPVIRVLTLNCALFRYGNPAADISAWQPDIVLLQEAFPYQVRLIADVLYGGRGDYRGYQTTGVVTRWKILQEVHDPTRRDQQVILELPDGQPMVVVNVHLTTAATDLRLWRRSAWTTHRKNRTLRLHELALTRQVLEQTTAFPNVPTILGGDFNASATDIVHRKLSGEFVDAFSAAGTGWGDTYQRRFPILRIDHIYATRHLVPVRSRVVASRHSDHRMVVADFLLK